MDSIELLPEEYWFYRVYSELTLALLHQVNNELTGALFLTELIQDDVDTGSPVGDKSSDLEVSIRKVIQMNQQITSAHFPDSAERGEPGDELVLLLEDSLPMLRLLLPKTVALRMDAHPPDFPSISVPRRELPLIFAAVAVLLSPFISRAAGELAVIFESRPAGLVFLPGGLDAEGATQTEANPGFLALKHRMQRLGGGVEFCSDSTGTSQTGLRLVLSRA